MGNIKYKNYDAIVIGAGGAGLISALNLAQENLHVACLSKVQPTKSHTIAAQGGINAPLGTVTKDHPDWLIYDTIKGGDYLSDHDSVRQLCYNANDAILDLEKIGVNFSKNKDGTIYQRKYGGQTTNFGQDTAYRACNVADRTGAEILNKLYEACLKHKVNFFSQIFILNLLIDKKQIKGVLGWDFSTGELIFFKSNFIIIATGGFSQIYKTNTSSAICTGDGNALALKAGIALQDMEFIQFHPTGLYDCGLLITEAARAEGGYLTSNKKVSPKKTTHNPYVIPTSELFKNDPAYRFMKDYAPQHQDLASRDIISRAIFNEIEQGRGYGKNKDYIYLHLEDLKEDDIHKQLPTVTETAKTFANIDVTKEPIPVAPSVHYTMGGIATNQYAQIGYYENNKENNFIYYKGLYAVGETASSSIHGANRLGCNSLLELIVFGKIAAQDIIKQYNQEKNNNKNISLASHQQAELDKYVSNFYKNFSDNNAIQENATEQKITDIISAHKEKLKEIMSKNVGVIKNAEKLQQAEQKLTILAQEINNIKINNHGLKDNFNLISLLELQNMLLQAIAATKTSLWRKESRGAHFRSDYQQRDDKNFMQHSLYKIDHNGKAIIFSQKIRNFLAKKDSRFSPKKRSY